MTNRIYSRIKIKEQTCVINNGYEFLPVGMAERESVGTIMNLSFGGALLKTPIHSQLNTSFLLHFPEVGGMKSFSINSQIVRLQILDESTAKKPIYLIGFKFIDPDLNLIENFIKCTEEPAKS